MYTKELNIGIEAVKTAMRITKNVQKEFTLSDSLTKSDKSPVTIADFTSQAVICSILNRHLPDIPIVGEEDSEALKQPQNEPILKKILSCIEFDPEVSSLINENNIFSSIDLGGQAPASRFWTLDPIDGTKGFLRGEQFSIALALIIDGKVVLGILGCPKLNLETDTSDSGYIFFTQQEKETEYINLETAAKNRVEISAISDSSIMRFVQSYESSHGNMEMQLKIADILKMKEKPVQLDSQVKYCIISSGNAEIYIRIPNPKTPDYKEKIWDHAAGSIIFENSGGMVSDIHGNKLDFGTGKTLKNNTGILATVPVIHPRIVDIIAEINQAN